MFFEFNFISYSNYRLSLKCFLKKEHKCLQNTGLRDIAHIADTFSTKGLDPQQIESISRIRYIAHECLRDQIGGPVIVTATPQVELGKRIRGKERVRRKGTGKRLRKDDPVQYNAASEDDQSQFYGTAIEVVDPLHLSQLDGEVQLIHADEDGENIHMGDANIEVDQSELAYTVGEENNVEPDHESARVNYEELHHATAGGEIKPELSHMTTDQAKMEKEVGAATKVPDAQPSDTPMEVDGAQARDDAQEVNNLKTSDASADANHTQLGHPSDTKSQEVEAR